jgi:propanol-preferring alcohol dehydrogenase
MRAARFFAVGERPRVVDVDVPEPPPGWVRVAVRACGLCGSDVHLVHGLTPTGPLPLTLGHESAGVVDAIGDGVDGWSGGERVALAAGFGCGSCDACVADAANRCPQGRIPGIDLDGSQAPYVVVPARSLIPLPESIDFAVGAILTDAVATPWHAVRRSGIQPGQTAVVFGAGGLGLHAVMLLSQVIGAEVIAVDTYPAALDRAARFGAAEVVDATAGKPAAAIRAMTGGGAHASFEMVGAASVADQAVKCLRPGGVCTVVGITPEPLALLPQALLVAGELTLQGSFGSTGAELGELVSLVAEGRLDLSETITHRFELEDFDRALQVLETKDGDPIRVVVEQPA